MAEPNESRRVFIAAGHGGRDPGYVAGELVERELNATVAARLVARLRDHGVDVATDLDHGNPPFPDEARLAHEVGGVAYYLALHHNAAGEAKPLMRGAETYGSPGAGEQLAAALNDAQVAALRTLDAEFPDRGVKNPKGTGAPKHLEAAPGAVVVVESSFLTSAPDQALIAHPDYVPLLTEALCRAVVDQGRVDGLWDAVFRPDGPELPPLFTVVVPTHDRPALLAEAVASALAQRVTGLEVVVVDDGSTPPVDGFDDPRVRLVRLDEMRGPGAARNAGIAVARGRHLAFLDDDDLWTPDRLDLALAGLRRAPVALCWTRHLGRPERGHRTLEGRVGDAVLEDTTPCLGATALRREVAAPFDERWTAIEDLVWWWDLARRAPVATVPSVGYLVRLHDGPRGRNTGDARVRENLALLEERGAFFGAHREAAAHRWLRVGILATEVHDHRRAVRAFARHLRLTRRPVAAVHLLAALVRFAVRWPWRRR